jgi:lysozyme
VLSWLQTLASRSGGGLQVGVDVSVFQGPPPDWRTAAAKFSWAAVKLTELEPGGVRYVNPDAAADWSWLDSHGKGRVAYFFGHPSVSAAETVSFFIGELHKLGLEDSDGVALDLETSDGKTPAEVDAWALAVLEELARKLDRKPLLYTFLSFAQGGNCARLGHFPLWIADPSSRRGHPRVPAPWKHWAIHQWVITGPIDRDVANYKSQQAMFHDLGKAKKEPDLHNLGGSIVGPLASARWPSGVTVVAGLGRDGFIQANRWVGGKWSGWVNVSKEKAKGGPSLITIGDDQGRLYFTDSAGAVIELDTSDTGQTWN